jgi:hypothetical protein
MSDTKPKQMTAEQKLKHLILIRHAELGDEPAPEDVTADNVDELYDATEGDNYTLQDAREEVRGGEHKTGLAVPYQGRGASNYESKSVARQYLDGSWIGWTYWYGGGKHSEPSAIDWIDRAYDVTVTEEPKTIIHRTFMKVEAPNEAV